MKTTKQRVIVNGPRIRAWVAAGALVVCAPLASMAINAVSPDTGGYSPDAKNAEKMKEQFNILNAKLDIIIKALSEAEE